MIRRMQRWGVSKSQYPVSWRQRREVVPRCIAVPIFKYGNYPESLRKFPKQDTPS